MIKERELQNNYEPMMCDIYLLMKGLLCSGIMRVNQLQMVEHYWIGSWVALQETLILFLLVILVYKEDVVKNTIQVNIVKA